VIILCESGKVGVESKMRFFGQMVGHPESSQTVLQAIIGDFHGAAVTSSNRADRSPGLLFSAVS
jgi:hypothetical protein